MQTLGTINNVELASRHSQSILKINTTILCWLTVNNDAEYIYIYSCYFEQDSLEIQQLAH